MSLQTKLYERIVEYMKRHPGTSIHYMNGMQAALEVMGQGGEFGLENRLDELTRSIRRLKGEKL